MNATAMLQFFIKEQQTSVWFQLLNRKLGTFNRKLIRNFEQEGTCNWFQEYCKFPQLICREFCKFAKVIRKIPND